MARGQNVGVSVGTGVGTGMNVALRRSTLQRRSLARTRSEQESKLMHKKERTQGPPRDRHAIWSGDAIQTFVTLRRMPLG
jgi:hypothetical protein